MAASIAEIESLRTTPLIEIAGDRRERRLKPINSRQRQHPRKDRPYANQHHEQFEEICKRLSLTNFSMAQKQIAPTTQIIRTPIKTESIATPFAGTVMSFGDTRDCRANRHSQMTPKLV
jgi:hypothetical protein